MNRRNFTKGLFGLAVIGAAPVIIAGNMDVIDLTTGRKPVSSMTPLDITREALRILEPKLTWVRAENG